ncbi:MAG: hypothetical protein LN569_05080 [Rickettsia endosymbiont of Labidopullus appendiculatus]|nr:hypothetical protein [Rickettsia endosymbiont of Labidopullus appendiculatus]
MGIKDPKPLIAIRLERKRKFRKLLQSIKEFNILNFCRSNLPQNEITYSFFGFFIIASTYSSLYTIDEAIRTHYHEIYNFIYHSVLIISTGFLTYPIWPLTFKNKKFIAIAWNLGIFYLLICVGSMLVIINKFNALQLMVFMLNLMITCILLRWQAVLFITISGIFISAQFFKYYMSEHLVGNSDDIQFQIIYVLLLFSSALIVFLKPKQQSQEISEFIKNCLDDDNKQKQFELIKLSQYREEFVNRLDKYCIGVFKSIHQQITNLDKQLQNNDIEISSDKEQMINIIDRLKAGAEYLNQVILQVKDLVKIHPVKVNFEQFIYDIIDEYKNTNSHHDLEIILDFKTNIKEIEIDPQLIKNTLLICINHGVTNSNISNVLISVCDTELEYDVNSPLKIKRDAVTLSIMVDNVTLTQQEISLVLQPTFNSINELNFAEIHKIITAHYGKINISLDNFGQVIYSITIPSRLREIRPKKMDLVDKQLDEVKAQNIQLISKNNAIVCNIAKQLIEIGMSLPTVARITKLTLEELQQLETKDSD